MQPLAALHHLAACGSGACPGSGTAARAAADSEHRRWLWVGAGAAGRAIRAAERHRQRTGRADSSKRGHRPGQALPPELHILRWVPSTQAHRQQFQMPAQAYSSVSAGLQCCEVSVRACVTVRAGVCNPEVGECLCPRHRTGPACEENVADVKATCGSWGFT